MALAASSKPLAPSAAQQWRETADDAEEGRASDSNMSNGDITRVAWRWHRRRVQKQRHAWRREMDVRPAAQDRALAVALQYRVQPPMQVIGAVELMAALASARRADMPDFAAAGRARAAAPAHDMFWIYDAVDGVDAAPANAAKLLGTLAQQPSACLALRVCGNAIGVEAPENDDPKRVGVARERLRGGAAASLLLYTAQR